MNRKELSCSCFNQIVVVGFQLFFQLSGGQGKGAFDLKEAYLDGKSWRQNAVYFLSKISVRFA